MTNLGRIAPRDRKTASTVIARSEATKQSIPQQAAKWIASLALAMTRIGRGVLDAPLSRSMTVFVWRQPATFARNDATNRPSPTQVWHLPSGSRRVHALVFYPTG